MEPPPVPVRRVLASATLALTFGNVIGALVVFALLVLVLPLPPVDDPALVRLLNAGLLALFLAVAVPLGVVWGLKRFRPARRWLEEGRPPTEREQRTALRMPARQIVVPAVLWFVAALLFSGLNVVFNWRLALMVGVTVLLGALGNCTIGLLLVTRSLRPVARAALRPGAPERLAAPGVTGRVLVAWALGTGVPALGLVLLSVGVLTGLFDAGADRLALSGTVLGGLALTSGFLAILLAARSIADPIRGVRKALRAVGEGDTDTEVEVYDGSEIGLLQAGFNDMVHGLRERERLRDLFGRQVGEEVAAVALERGVELGGEVRDVAVLFVDLVGSTTIAAQRPPEEVVELLNRFFGIVVEVVGEHGGTVNKFEGDAALVIFGAPLERDDAPGDALAAARDLCSRLADEVPEARAGIGVACGPAVAGNIGAAERFEYTVIGDAVNQAARLTELAKEREGRVLAARDAVDRARDEEASRWRDAGETVLRGRDRPTPLATP